MTESQALELVAMLQAAFPRPEMPDETVTLYTRFLMAMPYEEGATGVGVVMQSHEFLPTIAAISKAARSTSHHAALSGAEAWGQVVHAIKKFGRYRAPQFDVEAVADIVQCLGWEELCNSTNPIADRAHFLKLYAERVDVDRQHERRAALQGVGLPLQLKGAE